MRHSNRDSMKPNLALASLKDALSRESDRNLKYQEWILTHSAFDRPPRDVSMNELVKGSLETTITPGSSLPNPHSLQALVLTRLMQAPLRTTKRRIRYKDVRSHSSVD